jgi:hypothetical protein
MKNGQATGPAVNCPWDVGRYFVAVGSGTGLSESVCR